MEEPRINIDELFETKKRSDLNRLSIYSKLLSRIHHKIKMTSKQRDNTQFCSFIMPEVLLGYPNYDFSECLTFIIDRLNNDGFTTRYIHPNLIFICWSHWIPEYVRDEFKKKTNTEVNSYGESKPDKTVVRFEKTETNPVSNYKPSGMFVYDEEIIKSMKI